MEDSTGMESGELIPTYQSAAVLVEKLKEFRQSYNRTHGQVCEFFEQAHVIERLYHASGTSKPSKREPLSDGENDDDESHNEQKTWNIKQKLNSWRAVMREVVSDVCPNLQLENQPDINPGLMKHVLDEIRKLKTELAFQHNTILELTHQLESYQSSNQKKAKLVAKLLQRSKEIRLSRGYDSEDYEGMNGMDMESEGRYQGVVHFDQNFLQFGNFDCLSESSLDLEELSTLLPEPYLQGSIDPSSSTLSRPPLQSHALHEVTRLAPQMDTNKEESSSIHDDPSISGPSTLGSLPLCARWNTQRVATVFSRFFVAYMACKVLRKGTRQ